MGLGAEISYCVNNTSCSFIFSSSTVFRYDYTGFHLQYVTSEKNIAGKREYGCVYKYDK